MISDKIVKEQYYLENQISNVEKKLSMLPEGKLVCNKNGDGYKWFSVKDGKREYVPKVKEDYARKLALGTYYSCVRDELIAEKEMVDKYLCCMEKPKESGRLMMDNPEFQRLLSFEFAVVNEEFKKWAEEPFVSNPYSPEALIHKSSSGHMVRSKAESMIDSRLYENKIPFRYEASLVLGNKVIYPDFTIRHPVNGELYYWEHFGFMTDPEYAKNAFEKMKRYTSNGIIPSINLIMTFETKERPLNFPDIENIIHQYFL